MEDIIKVVKFLEESGLMTKGASETIENKVNEAKSPKKVGFLAFGGSLLVNLFSGKGERESSRVALLMELSKLAKIRLEQNRDFNASSSFT